MHIVFIVGNYYPNYSAVGKCVSNIAHEFSKDHKVTVICKKNFVGEKSDEVINNQRIIRVDTKDNNIRNKLSMKINRKSGFLNFFYKTLLYNYKIIRVAKTIFSRVTVMKGLVNSYESSLSSLKEPIDIIIPSSMPFESVIATYKFTKKNNFNGIVIPYIFDQFVDSATLHRHKVNKVLKRNLHLELERKVLSPSFHILAMHSLRKHFSVELVEHNNINYVEHPLITQADNLEESNDVGIKISYIGGLYKDYVEPNYMLNLFKETDMHEGVLNFFIVGNCDDVINKYSKYMPGKIINHGTVDKQTANSEISKSNILISIAEKKGVQMSSKIFEYMSYGKPIIHFYNVDDDVNLKILNKYPLALCIKQDYSKIDKNIESFSNFCKKHSRSHIPYKTVESIFPEATPEYTVKLIKKIYGQSKLSQLN